MGDSKVKLWLTNTQGRIMGQRRKTPTDGIVREYWNSYITELEYHEGRAETKTRMKNPETKKYDPDRFALLVMYQQADSLRRNTRWFIILTIVLILATLFNTIFPALYP